MSQVHGPLTLIYSPQTEIRHNLWRWLPLPHNVPVTAGVLVNHFHLCHMSTYFGWRLHTECKNRREWIHVFFFHFVIKMNNFQVTGFSYTCPCSSITILLWWWSRSQIHSYTQQQQTKNVETQLPDIRSLRVNKVCHSASTSRNEYIFSSNNKWIWAEQ